MTKEFKRLLVTAAGFISLLPACAHQQNQALDSSLQAEPTIQTSEELQDLAIRQIRTAPELTDDERSRLLELQNSTHSKLRDLKEQSWKLRELLVKDLVAPQYNPGEVEQIKDRIKETENLRLATIFSAIKEANSLLGRVPSPRRSIVYQDFVGGHGL